MKRLITPIVISLYSGVLLAQTSELALVKPQVSDETLWKKGIAVPNLYLSKDSESFTSTKVGGAALPLYEHGDRYTGVTYQFNRYSQNSWAADGNQFGLITKDINPRTALGYNLSLNLNNLKGYNLLTTDSQVGVQLTDTTRAELLVNRDRVETQNAINNGIYYTLGAISIEQKIIERLSLIAMGGNMYFSDSNTRPFFRLRGIYDLWPEYGVTAQIRYRQYRDTDTDVPNNYFNPNKYNETMVVFGVKKRVQGWIVSGLAGMGRQRVNSDPTTGTQLLEASVASPFVNKVFYRSRAGYSKSAGFQSPDYSYRFFMQELIFTF